ncbi:GATA zinc finger [Dictyocaulus viviparus]|uniref:GATA zinc finger n=1 Tax=Dictyocaulus viviparus TaxID=29172 RepID=A0A0D8XET9_DICVI|nr:GATA zinc finger [Dictyocaulus viviparus]
MCEFSEHTLPTDPYSIDKMMTREHNINECHSTSDPYHDFFAKESIHHIMDSHQIHMNASVCSLAATKKLYENEHSSFECNSSSLCEIPYSSSMNVLLYDMPPMRMYPSSSRCDLEVNTTSQLPTVFSIPSTTYLSHSQSPIEYLPNAYSPPPQDPVYQTKSTSQHMSSQNKPKKRIQAVPCHSNSICANCKTTETTLWRRAKTGEIECNACNLYFRKNNTKRPMSLCKDTIMKRNRKPRADTSTTTKHSMSG